jgi:hypothetical protein
MDASPIIGHQQPSHRNYLLEIESFSDLAVPGVFLFADEVEFGGADVAARE